MCSDNAIVLRARNGDKGYDRGSSPFVPISARHGYRTWPPGKGGGELMEFHATFPPVPATVAQALVGIRPGDEWIADPYGERAETQPASVQLGLDAVSAIERVIAVQQRYWAI